jgi:predicted transcriptional regulator
LVSTLEVIHALYSDSSFLIFKTVATQSLDSRTLKIKTKLTRKQYYTGMYKLAQSGLIEKRHGHYFLTTLGEIVHNSLHLIENGIEVYWKLKTIDALKTTKSDMPKSEHKNLVDTLIEDKQLKEIIVKNL